MPVTQDGRYHTVFRDAQNSTTTPLAGGASWAGMATENNMSHVMVSCASDTDGTIRMCFSVDDGQNWDALDFPVTAGANFFKILVKGQRRYRTEFINHGGQQVNFRLETDFGTFTAPMSPASGGMLVELAGPQTETPTGNQAFPVIDFLQISAADTLQEILEELRVMNMHMTQITDVKWDKEDL